MIRDGATRRETLDLADEILDATGRLRSILSDGKGGPTVRVWEAYLPDAGYAIEEALHLANLIETRTRTLGRRIGGREWTARSWRT